MIASRYNQFVDIHELFSANLARIRKQKGLSQRQLAEMTGISYRMICHYETKATAVPMNKLKTLADSLKVRIADFFDEEGANMIVDDIDVRWIKKINEIRSLSEADQQELNRHINSLLKKTSLQKQVNQQP